MFEALHTNIDGDAEFVQFYAKMAQTLAVSGVVGQNPSALLSLQIPGIVVRPGLDPEDPETQYYVSNLLNAALECNYVVTLKAGLTSDVYKLILDGKETPIIDLSPQEKKDLRAAEDYLGEPGGGMSPAFKIYIKYAEQLYAAQDRLFTDEATEANGGAKVPAAVRNRYAAAQKAWVEKGNKYEVETALATIRQLQGRDPYIYWQRLADRFARSTSQLKNGSEFQHIDSLPRYEEWFRDELWTPFSFDENDYRRQPRSGGIGMQGQCRCCCGASGPFGDPAASRVWRDGAWTLAARRDPDGPAERGPLASVATGQIRLRCAIKRVTILRPWMDTAVFASRLWKWSPQSIGRGITISTGGSVAGNQVASGVLPVLPTTALLAKDIEVATTSREVFEWLQTRIAGGQEVRYGPFRLDAIRQTAKSEACHAFAAVGIATGAAPELFGYISTIFGKCPNPDMTLHWPS